MPRPKLRVPPALVINLPRDAERFAGVKKQMDDQGVYFERIDAVNGRALSESERRANATAAARALLTPGMIGCYLSHRKCWQLCVEGGHDAVLVFEDDAVLMPEFKSKLLGAMEDVPDDWDVLLLGGLAAVHPKLKFGVAGWGALSMYGISMPETLRWPKRISERVHVPVRPAGTHAYAVSARGAAKLLSICPRANFHVDLAAWGRAASTYTVNPLLAKQTHEDDDRRDGRPLVDPHFVDEYTGRLPVGVSRRPPNPRRRHPHHRTRRRPRAAARRRRWNTPICLLFGFLLTWALDRKSRQPSPSPSGGREDGLLLLLLGPRYGSHSTRSCASSSATRPRRPRRPPSTRPPRRLPSSCRRRRPPGRRAARRRPRCPSSASRRLQG